MDRPVNIIRLRKIITLIAAVAILIHIIWPSIAIDWITLSLFAIAILPWLAPLLKKLELPGGLKIEFRALEKTKEKANMAGLLASSAEMDKTSKYSFQDIAEEDPNLVLAGLRIEIEKKLRELAQLSNISVQRKININILMKLLLREGVLTKQEHDALADMVGLLNLAVHGAKVDNKSADLAMEVGLRLLKALEEKTSRVKKQP